MTNILNERHNEPRRLLNEREVADWLNLSERTLQGWRLRGEGPAFEKLGRSVRYSPASVEAWIVERERCSTSAVSAPDPCSIQGNGRPSDFYRGGRS